MFRAESAEHAQAIEAGLLELERTLADPALLEEVFRQAHSLKGAARMLGLYDIQNLAHSIENALSDARQGKDSLNQETVPVQLQKLDQIRQLVAQAVGDAPLQPISLALPTEAETVDSARSDTVSHVDSSASTPTTSEPLAHLHLDTLRVDAKRLDRLMQLSGELVVNKGSLTRWSQELDDILGRLSTLIHQSDAPSPALAPLISELSASRKKLDKDLTRLSALVSDLEGGIRSLRLVPMSTLLDLFPRAVHDLSAELGKKVSHEFTGGSTVADKRIIEEMKAPLMHLLRNCIDHGIEPPQERVRTGKPEQGQIRVEVSQWPDAVHIIVRDDGRGLDLTSIRQQALKQRLHTHEELDHMSESQLHALIMRSGFSTSRMITDVSGRGVGLDVVRTSVERLHGTIQIESNPGRGTSIDLRLPVSLTATRAMLVREWGQTYALPFDDIVFMKRIASTQLYQLENRHVFYHLQQAIPVERLGLILGRPAPAFNEKAPLNCVVIRLANETFALGMDAVLEMEDLVVQPTRSPLKRVRNVAGLAVLSTGEVCTILNVYDLLRSMGQLQRADQGVAAESTSKQQPSKRILLVEDSITTRMQERRILESAGYEVETAVDGMDAWNKLSFQHFDAVVSDVQMPRMSGLELAGRIRHNHKFTELPIVLITSLASESDRRLGLEAGADAYISKSEFDQTALLDCLARLT